MKGFKYQITVAAFLSKQKIIENTVYTEYSPVYFNSITKTAINSEFSLDKPFQEVLYRIDNWINEGSGWIIESKDGEHVNISAYSPLIESKYVELSNDLKNSRKDLIKIKNDDNKCFLWCHIRHLNSVKIHPERITKKDKEMVSELGNGWIRFPVSKKDYCKTEKQNNIRINVFCYENKLTYPVYLSNRKFSDCMDLLLISSENKSHYVYFRDFNRFMFNKTKNRNKKFYVDVVYSVVKKF